MAIIFSKRMHSGRIVWAKLFGTKTFLIMLVLSIVSSAPNLNDGGIFETIGKKTCVKKFDILKSARHFSF